MELYLYKILDKSVITKIEKVLSYTDNTVVTEDGVYSPLAEGVELSSLPDCSEMLRAGWKQDHPSSETRLEELEVLMAELLYGGERT